MFLLFDIGGTKTRIAISRDRKKFEKPRIIATPRKFEDGLAAIGIMARELALGEKIEAAAGGIAGTFDKAKTVSVRSPHLPDWAGKPLKKELETALGAPVILENDAALAGLGEAMAGAGRGNAIVAYITVGTGVGGARIVNGAIDENAMGFEPGHQYIDRSGSDFEALVSGSALTKRFGKDPREIHDPAVWEELAELLAYGLHNTIVHWSPDRIVFGGSMMLGDPAIPLDRVAFHLTNILTIFSESPPLMKSALSDASAIQGACILLSRLRAQ